MDPVNYNKFKTLQGVQIRSILLLANFKEKIKWAEYQVEIAEKEARIITELADAIESRVEVLLIHLKKLQGQIQ